MGNNSIEKGQHVEMLQRMSPENINLCWTLPNMVHTFWKSQNVDRYSDTCKSRHTRWNMRPWSHKTVHVDCPWMWYSRKRAPRKVPTRVFNSHLALFNNFPYHRLHWNLRRPTLFCLASSHHHVQVCGDISRNTNIRIENQIERRPFESIWIVRYLIFLQQVFWRFSRSLLDLACLQIKHFCLVFRLWFYLGFCLVSHARLGPGFGTPTTIWVFGL